MKEKKQADSNDRQLTVSALAILRLMTLQVLRSPQDL